MAERDAAQHPRLAIDAGRLAVWEADQVPDRVTGSPELNRRLGVLGDITERRRAEEDLRAGEARLRLASAGVWDRALASDAAIWSPQRARRSGSTERMVGIEMDVTEQHRAAVAPRQEAMASRDEAAESQQVLHGVHSLSKDPFAVAGFDGALISVNRAWSRLLGVSEIADPPPPGRRGPA